MRSSALLAYNILKTNCDLLRFFSFSEILSNLWFVFFLKLFLFQIYINTLWEGFINNCSFSYWDMLSSTYVFLSSQLVLYAIDLCVFFFPQQTGHYYIMPKTKEISVILNYYDFCTRPYMCVAYLSFIKKIPVNTLFLTVIPCQASA